MRHGWIVVLALSLAGCLASESRTATWSYVHATVIRPACTTAGCHSTLTAAAGLDLSSSDGAYTFLTGRICGAEPLPQDAPRSYVVPGSAASSQLVYQLRGADDRGRPYRDVMPPDMPLPDVEVELVVAWIEDGARCE
ncbi:MAG: hypothetical protein ACKV2T_22595 [Kofleriaceae bacterium]